MSRMLLRCDKCKIEVPFKNKGGEGVTNIEPQDKAYSWRVLFGKYDVCSDCYDNLNKRPYTWWRI